MARLIQKFKTAARGRGWALWGAGAKGVAFLSQWRGEMAQCVVDSNPAKQGCVIPGSDVPIVGPNDPRALQLGLIVIANPNYAAEIRQTLKTLGFKGRVMIL